MWNRSLISWNFCIQTCWSVTNLVLNSPTSTLSQANFTNNIFSLSIYWPDLYWSRSDKQDLFSNILTGPTYWISNTLNIYHDIKISRLYINNVLWEINCTSLKYVNMLASNILSATTLQIHTVQICRLVNATDWQHDVINFLFNNKLFVL